MLHALIKLASDKYDKCEKVANQLEKEAAAKERRKEKLMREGQDMNSTQYDCD